MPQKAKPKVFLSATTHDLGSYRLRARGVFDILGIEAVEQTGFDNTDKNIEQKLCALIDECQAVVHIVGKTFGWESDHKGPDGTNRSYTQFERDYALSQDIPVFVQSATDACKFDVPDPEPDPALAARQESYRQELVDLRLDMPPFSNYAEFENALFRIRWPFPVNRPPRRVFSVPFPSIGNRFVGRDDELRKLREALTHSDGGATAINPPIAATWGLGGIGKTRLAIEYAYKYGDDYDAVLFLNAATPQVLDENLANCYGELVADGPGWEQLPAPERLREVLAWFGNNDRWLLALENVDDQTAAAAVEARLAQLTNGHVILTARYSHWSNAVTPIEIDVLDEAVAARFLRDRTAGHRTAKPDDDAESLALAKELGGLCLALEQAGAYIDKVKPPLSFADYRKRIATESKRTLGWHDQQLMGYPRSVFAAILASIDLLDDNERQWLQTFAWFAPEPIPLVLFTANEKLREAVENALTGLADLSLVKFNAEGDAVTVHRLVQQVTRDEMDDDARNGSRALALAMLNAGIPDPDYSVEGWALWSRIASHCRLLLTAVRDTDQEEDSTRLANNIAYWLHNRAEHAEAEPLYRRVAHIFEKSLGPEHPNVATALNNLAGLLQATNRLDEAEPMYRRVAHIFEKSLGPEHPNVATGLNNLAELLRATNRLAEAEPFSRRQLEIFLIFARATGHEHPHLRAAFGNYAGLLSEMGRSKTEIAAQLSAIAEPFGIQLGTPESE